MAELEQLSGPPDCLSGDCASFLNELLLFHQAAEVLLVDQAACKRLNTALQLQQGELRRHQLEHDRTVFDLGAKPGDPGREDAAMIGGHRPARNDGRRAAAVARGFRDQRGLVEQFVALQDQFLIPLAVIKTKRDRSALPAFALQRR